LASCGLDGLIFTPRGFDPTEAPAPIIAGETRPGAMVLVYAKTGALAAEAVSEGLFEIRLPPSIDGTNLTVIAIAGAHTVKAIVARAAAGEITDIGPVDDFTTALAQLATYEVQREAGSTMAATPPAALAQLIASVVSSPTPELDAFVAIVSEILSAPADPPFDALTPDLSAALGPELGGRYRAALQAAAEPYGLVIRCDPSRLNTLFTVDVSGRGRDGNGAPQLIRQPSKEARVYLGYTTDESSAISDPSIPNRLTPNDPRSPMTDDGQGGDEAAGDGIYSAVIALPRGARIIYKYTNGAAGEGFTGTEEWPGNARILQIDDVLTGRPDGEPDCLVVRRDSFGDEATNKNFVNIHAKAKARGGTVGYDTDLGGAELSLSPSGLYAGGLPATAIRSEPPLTPSRVPEARENGVCSPCPAPLVLDPDDATPPVLLSAERIAVDRVRARFSEPLHAEDAAALDRFQYLDDAGRSVPIRAASPSGSDVVLILEPTHPRTVAELRVRSVRDASARMNLLDLAAVPVAADATPPKLLEVRALSILDVAPNATPADPTVGDIVELVFDERPEESAASDARRYAIDGLPVIAALLIEEERGPLSPAHRVQLATAVQEKGRAYTIAIDGIRDPAGNALLQEASFDGFALYRATFGVVTGFAFASSDGASRGTARGEALYLTGTPLAVARGLDGRDISVVRSGFVRTDVTGWPQFEMKAGSGSHEGQPIFEVSMLLPKGSYAWKAAHGVEGEYVRPPTTLEKVYKTLATANDATGVRVDPRTLIAANGADYAGARLSEAGDEPPRRDVVFKREAPDEVCDVAGRDTVCPFILAGTWRDLVFDQGGRTRDYDDGIITLDPHRPSLPDFSAPKLLDARARDSFSILLSFDEAIASSGLSVSVVRADDGFGVPVSVLASSDLGAHQAVIRIDGDACDRALLPDTAYTVRYRGAEDDGGRADRTLRTATVLAPGACVPFTPLVDVVPPQIGSVEATDLTEIVVRFDERLDPATVAAPAFAIIREATATPLALIAADLLPDRSSVRLTTEPQRILEPYRLEVSGLRDASDPPNTLTSASIAFIGFGELDPPGVAGARAIAVDRVVVTFDEPVESPSAMDPARYAIGGLEILSAAFSGDPGRRTLAFNAALAPRIRDVVVLETSPMTPGVSYALSVDGVRDLSGNAGQATVSFIGVAAPPVIDVILEVEIGDARPIAGQVPSRAISLAELSDAREGVFVLGARASADHTPAAGRDPPVNDALGGFGVEGQPLDGIEPRLIDTGAAPDAVQGDGVFTILIPDVPLGTTVIWKAFAPYSTSYRDRNPSDTLAAFADALPGPSVFADGQEYPGNENGAVILDGGAGGRVRIRSLFGDEVTYKKFTGNAAYVWVTGDRGL
jgi:hypothetical protein